MYLIFFLNFYFLLSVKVNKDFSLIDDRIFTSFMPWNHAVLPAVLQHAACGITLYDWTVTICRLSAATIVSVYIVPGNIISQNIVNLHKTSTNDYEINRSFTLSTTEQQTVMITTISFSFIKNNKGSVVGR